MDIRYAIGVVKYGFEEYQKAIEENPNFDINEKDQFQCTLLHNAVSMRKWDIAKDLIKRGIDVTPQDYKGCTVLHFLCDNMNADVETVEMVLKAGGNPNIKNKDEMSPLYIIAGSNWNKNTEARYQILKLLMEHGGDKTLPCTKQGVSTEEVVERIGDLKTIAILKQYAPIRSDNDGEDIEMRYLPIMDEIKIMLREKNITDGEIWKKISETPEIIKIKDKRSSTSLFLLTISSGRLELAKKLAENGADLHEETKLPFFNGNALNGATTTEMADWLLSLGLKVEKNLVREQEQRTTPYDNPAVNAANRKDTGMMRYWLTKEKELFAEEPEYLEELLEKTISVAAKVNYNSLLEFIIRDEELYPYLKKDYSDGTGWNPKMSAKLRKQTLKLIESEELKPQVKELTKILTERTKEKK